MLPRMTAAVLSIGTELTRGELVNTNAAWLAAELTTHGLEVTSIDCVADDPQAIGAVLERLAAAHTLIVCTGGLGPTTDDITSECVAKALGVPLARDAASLERIRERFARFQRVMAPSNEKQADFPAGAVVLANDRGTAPGFAVSLGRARAFFMPGVPVEMKPMFERFVVPELAAKVTDRFHQEKLQSFGLPESTVNDRLAGVEAAHGVTVGYRAHFPVIEVKLLARAASLAEAERRARAARDEVCSRLGEHVFAEGDRELAEVVGELLQARGLRLGVAESCTGGQIAALVTAHAGSSAHFVGGIVSYSNELKEKLLGVPAATLATHGAVSPETARAMAKGALRALDTDVAVAVTGIAGPGGGSEQKPVGLVHLAVATRGTAAPTGEGVTLRELRWPGQRSQVQKLAAHAALDLVRRVLQRGHEAEPR
jgi:nicotinamide-nucleotide amidase